MKSQVIKNIVQKVNKSSNKEIYEILEIGINYWDCLTSEQKANKICYFLAGDEEEIWLRGVGKAPYLCYAGRTFSSPLDKSYPSDSDREDIISTFWNCFEKLRSSKVSKFNKLKDWNSLYRKTELFFLEALKKIPSHELSEVNLNLLISLEKFKELTIIHNELSDHALGRDVSKNRKKKKLNEAESWGKKICSEIIRKFESWVIKILHHEINKIYQKRHGNDFEEYVENYCKERGDKIWELLNLSRGFDKVNSEEGREILLEELKNEILQLFSPINIKEKEITELKRKVKFLETNRLEFPTELIETLTTNRTFLIQQALKLSNQIIKGEKDLQTLGQENLLLNKQNLLQAQTITELEAEIEILEKLATKELRSKNRENDNLQYEIGDLEEVIKKAVISLGKEKKKTKKLNYVKKVGSLLMEKLRNDLTDLKSEFRNAQAEISQLKQENQDLEERKKEIKKESNAKIKELKNKSTEQQATIQQLQDEKTSLEQEKTRVEEELSSERSQFEEQKKNWQQREQKLLAEIELLKNPPLTSENKENVKQNVIVKEIIKEVFIKSLESNELGFKLSADEKDKLDNLSLQEMEVYHSQLIKGKVNHLENQVKQLGLSKSRERERERLFDEWF